MTIKLFFRKRKSWQGAGGGWPYLSSFDIAMKPTPYLKKMSTTEKKLTYLSCLVRRSKWALVIRESSALQEEGNCTPSTLAWKITWMEEPGRLQSMRSLKVGHDWASSHSLFTFMHWRRKWQPTPMFLPGKSQGWGAWQAAVYGVASVEHN